MEDEVIKMENYMMINGVKIPLNDEKVKILENTCIIPSLLFSRAEKAGTYYYITAAGHCRWAKDTGSDTDYNLYKVGNYCKQRHIMHQRALHEILNRLLWRFSMENGEGENPWDNTHQHYYITYKYIQNEFGTAPMMWRRNVGSIYFPSEDIANRAIEEIVKPFMKENPTFVW